MKVEEVQKNIEGGMKGIGNFIKRNPFVAIVGVIVVVFLVFLFGSPRRRREEVAAPQQLPQPQAVGAGGAGALGFMHMLEDVMVRQEELAAHKQAMFAAHMTATQEAIAAQAARQEELAARKHAMLAAQQERHAAQLAAQQERFAGQKQAMFDALRDIVAVPAQPQVIVIEPQHDEQIYENIAARQEELAAQVDAIHDVLRDDRVEPVVEAVTEPTHEIKFDLEVLDYYADPQKYKREIMREDVIRPPRPRRDDKILTAEGEWEPVESVIARQKQRYEDALARGDTKWAEIVRRETEIALGHAVDWDKKDKKRAGRFDREKHRQRLLLRARRVR